MKSVLFVCMGNICRSPTGEGVLQHLVDESGLQDRIRIDSAGTIGYHSGNPADPRMSKAAARRGYNLTSRARQVSDSDFDSFDLVIAMDHENMLYLRREYDGSSRAKLKMLSDFLDDSWPEQVPDPYYGGDDGFEYVLDMIEAACPKILAELQ
ncbi:MAG: low molecular weight protein-tyrosine-phosphatase [Planctomycetota bacterium]